MYIKGVILAALFSGILFGCDGHREQKVIENLRSAGFISEEATIVYVRDSHGGFHGDGSLFLTFIEDDSRPEAHKIDREWKNLPLELRAQRTFNAVVSELEIPKTVLPNITSNRLVYFVDDSYGYREDVTSNLLIYDTKKHQYWYIELTL